MKPNLPAVFWVVMQAVWLGVFVNPAWASPFEPDSIATPSQPRTDTLSNRKPFLLRGQLSGRLRTFWMSTHNSASLPDYYALAMGAGIGYRTARIAGHIELGVSAFFSNNLLSSGLAAKDPVTGQSNRYEVGLFNLQHPGSHSVISRLEELYVAYRFGKKSSVILGRQLPHSPFINPQDGRLSPTFVEGLTAEWSELPTTKVQLEVLTRMAPRSTVGWHGIGESIGLYPAGVDATGKASQYRSNTQSTNIIQAGITQKVGHVTLQLWDTRVQNIFNLTYARADLIWPVAKKRQWIGGLQAVRQWAIGNGGNPDPAKAYNQPGNRSLVVSGRFGYQTTRWATYTNATRITAEGRFLFPREWGRELFYTFLMRERNEGFGDVSAVSTNLFFTPIPQVKGEASLGYYWLPNVKNVALNKYGMPGYRQTNLSITYRFKGSLCGVDTQALWVAKTAVGNTYTNDRYVLNKVGMNQLNVILNYHF